MNRMPRRNPFRSMGGGGMMGGSPLLDSGMNSGMNSSSTGSITVTKME